FTVEKVVIEELDGRRAVPVTKGGHGLPQARRSLQLRVAVEHRHDTAELAVVAATDGRLMNGRPRPQKGRAQILLNVSQALVRDRGEVVGGGERPRRIVHDLAGRLPAETPEPVHRPRAPGRRV